MTAPRTTSLILLSVLLVALIALIAPQQLGVMLYKLSLVMAAATAGYWFDRVVFRTRPHEEETDHMRGMAYQRRALIVGSSMIAMAMAL